MKEGNWRPNSYVRKGLTLKMTSEILKKNLTAFFWTKSKFNKPKNSVTLKI